MHIIFANQHLQSTPIKSFRQTYELPATFSVALFEPKDYTGLASIDRAGAEMNELRQALLAAVPTHIRLVDVLPLFDTLQQLFRSALYGINERVGLRVEDIEFAVAGFGDVTRDFAYALIRAKTTHQDPPDFHSIYYEWIQHSARLSTTVHEYPYQNTVWRVQVVNHVYGRFGLLVQFPPPDDSPALVMDTVYLCPAEGFMQTLLNDLATLVVAHLD